MDDALGMCCPECSGNLNRQFQHLVERKRLARNAVLQGLAVEDSEFTVKKIRVPIDVSHPYATLIKRGDRIPHPRHWDALAKLVGLVGVSRELPSAEH